uniref:Class II aldolase/adducin N-terminal domain-containing protein n=1 Tax=Bionectria ochroleuca TaxID=29856 RepID=A0A8H7NHW5_BIOOC
MSTRTSTAFTQVLSLNRDAASPHTNTAAEARSQPQTSTSAALSACGTGGFEVEGIPKIDDPYKKRQWQLEHMAGAFRVFARKGYTEGTAGHISVRDPVDPSTFWINPLGVHFGLLKASDMVHINEAGEVIGGAQRPVNAAGFMIHSAIHKARPDINAVCHTLSRGHGMTVYENFGGVVLEKAEGERIAAVLGDKNRVAILQNHGLLTAGSTVDEAAYLFTSLERTCEVQIMVESTNLPKKRIGHDEAQFTANVNADPATLYTEFQLDFEYEIRKSKGELNKGI